MPIIFPRTSYDEPDLQQRPISNILSIIDPVDTPLVAFLGNLKGSLPPGWRITAKGRKIEWIERGLMPTSDSLLASISNTVTTISVSDSSYYHAGDVLLIESEMLRVSDINDSTNTITVERGAGESDAAAHAASVTIKLIGNARSEGQENTRSGRTTATTRYNVTQIFHDSVEVTGTEQVIPYYGYGSPLDFEIKLSLQQIMRDVEAAYIYPYLNEPSDATSSGRIMRGLEQWLVVADANTVSATGGTLGIDAFQTAARLARMDGGRPRVAVVSPLNKQRINNIYQNSSYLRVERSETTVGMEIEQVQTGNGLLSLLVSRFMPDNKIFLLDPDHVAAYALRPFFTEKLAKTGDSEVAEIVGELTLLVRHPTKAHATIVGITA